MASQPTGRQENGDGQKRSMDDGEAGPHNAQGVNETRKCILLVCLNKGLMSMFTCSL